MENFGMEMIKVSEFKKIAYSEKIKEYQKEAFIESIKHKEEISNHYDEKSVNIILKDKLKFYKDTIETFENIHHKYSNNYNIINDETPIAAFFILFSRIISLLKMTLNCLENNFLDASILFRPIDEAISLAEYFMFSANDEKGKMHLKQWFRENKSPANRICRDFIKEYSKNRFSDKRKEFFDNDFAYRLYNQKSKPIHSTLNDIISNFKAEIENNNITYLGFEYGKSSDYMSVWQTVEFFQSSVWTSIQGFMICILELDIISDEDFNSLFSLHKLFLTEVKKRNSNIMKYFNEYITY
jgi:hypothetical protein